LAFPEFFQGRRQTIEILAKLLAAAQPKTSTALRRDRLSRQLEEASLRPDRAQFCAFCAVRTGAPFKQRRADSISASVAPLLRAQDSAAVALYFAT
jgi:hypothetical protein